MVQTLSCCCLYSEKVFGFHRFSFASGIIFCRLAIAEGPVNWKEWQEEGEKAHSFKRNARWGNKGGRERDAFHKAVRICSAEMTKHARMDTLCCVSRSVVEWCVLERCSHSKFYLISPKPSPWLAHAHLCLLCLRACKLCCCSEQMWT